MIRLVIGSSSPADLGQYLCVDLGCRKTRHARRSDTLSFALT
jgi:hypothetical protein